MRRKLTSNLKLTTPKEERAKLLLSKAGIVYYFALLNPGCTAGQIYRTLPECFPSKHPKQGPGEIRGYAHALSEARLLELRECGTRMKSMKQYFADPSFLVESYLAQRNITNPKLKEWLTGLVKENAKQIFGFEYSTRILQPYYLYGHRGFTEFKENNGLARLNVSYDFDYYTDNLEKVKTRSGYDTPGSHGYMGSTINKNPTFFFRYLFGGLGRPEHPVIAYDAALETLHYFFRFAYTLRRELSTEDWIYMLQPEAEDMNLDNCALAIDSCLRNELNAPKGIARRPEKLKVSDKYRGVIRVAFSPYLSQIFKQKTIGVSFNGEYGAFMGLSFHPLVIFWDNFEKDYAFSVKFFKILAKDCLAEAELISNRYMVQQLPNGRELFSQLDIGVVNDLLEYTKKEYDEVKQYSRLLNKFFELRRKKKHADLCLPLVKMRRELIFEKYADMSSKRLDYDSWSEEYAPE